MPRSSSSGSAYRQLEIPLFLFAIASTVWYLGCGARGPRGCALGSHVQLFLHRASAHFQVAISDRPVLRRFRALRGDDHGVHRRPAPGGARAPPLARRLQKEVIERRKREEQIRELNQQLERRSAELKASNKELEAFAYSISHDLRAPLRHMVGFAELLQQHAATALDEKSRRLHDDHPRCREADGRAHRRPPRLLPDRPR